MIPGSKLLKRNTREGMSCQVEVDDERVVRRGKELKRGEA